MAAIFFFKENTIISINEKHLLRHKALIRTAVCRGIQIQEIQIGGIESQLNDKQIDLAGKTFLMTFFPSFKECR